MRRSKRDRNKPIPITDLEQVAKFRAELGVYAKLKEQGRTHREACVIVWHESVKQEKKAKP